MSWETLGHEPTAVSAETDAPVPWGRASPPPRTESLSLASVTWGGFLWTLKDRSLTQRTKGPSLSLSRKRLQGHPRRLPGLFRRATGGQGHRHHYDSRRCHSRGIFQPPPVCVPVEGTGLLGSMGQDLWVPNAAACGLEWATKPTAGFQKPDNR